MKISRYGHIDLVGFLRSVIGAEVFLPPVHSDDCLETASYRFNPLIASGGVGFDRGIKFVLSAISFSQIVPSIVKLIEVYVVEFCYWIFSGHHFPNEAMSEVSDPVHNNFSAVFAVFSSLDGTGSFAFEATVPYRPRMKVFELLKGSMLPCEFPRKRFVMKNLPKIVFGGHRSGSYGHAVLPWVAREAV
jgi:hypothetical protein